LSHVWPKHAAGHSIYRVLQCTAAHFVGTVTI